MPPPPTSTLFPYTTLFRSHSGSDVSLDEPPRWPCHALAPRLHNPGHFNTLVMERKLRSEEHTSELQSRRDLVCRLLLEKKKRRRDRGAATAGRAHCARHRA